MSFLVLKFQIVEADGIAVLDPHVLHPLEESGLFQRMEDMGVQDGDTVCLYNLEFEYQK